VARKVYEKRTARKTSVELVAAMRMKAATDSEANAGRDMCVSWPGSCREVVETLAAMRVALACVKAHMAAFERLLERRRLVAAAAAGK